MKKLKFALTLFMAAGMAITFSSYTSSSEATPGNCTNHAFCQSGNTHICKKRNCTIGSCNLLVNECVALGKGETADCKPRT